MSKLTKYEQETIIIYNQEESLAIIETFDPVLIRKLDKLCLSTKGITVETTTKECRVYKLPKRWIKVSAPKQLSEESRQKLSERARANLHRKTGESES